MAVPVEGGAQGEQQQQQQQQQRRTRTRICVHPSRAAGRTGRSRSALNGWPCVNSLPQNEHPICRLGFDSSDVEARRS